MNSDLYETLFEEGCIRQETLVRIREKRRNPLFSLHWELKTLLYLGVMLLSTGLGILIYKNIDTIGHQVILAGIAGISIGCFYYCYRHKRPFSLEKTATSNPILDYLLLLACLSFLSFLGYLQFQYGVFGENYGLATFIPMLVLFYVAYDFDHLGILSIAITNLGLWVGIAVNPMALISNIDQGGRPLILTAISLGLFLVAMGFISERYRIKKHFHFSYTHFGAQVAFIALLFGYFYDFEQESSITWIILLFTFAWYIYRDGIAHKSFYFVLLCVVYTYIGCSAVVVHYLIKIDDIAILYLASIYFIGSAVLFIKLLIHLNKKVKAL